MPIPARPINRNSIARPGAQLYDPPMPICSRSHCHQFHARATGPGEGVASATVSCGLQQEGEEPTKNMCLIGSDTLAITLHDNWWQRAGASLERQDSLCGGSRSFPRCVRHQCGARPLEEQGEEVTVTISTTENRSMRVLIVEDDAQSGGFLAELLTLWGTTYRGPPTQSKPWKEFRAFNLRWSFRKHTCQGWEE